MTTIMEKAQMTKDEKNAVKKETKIARYRKALSKPVQFFVPVLRGYDSEAKDASWLGRVNYDLKKAPKDTQPLASFVIDSKKVLPIGLENVAMINVYAKNELFTEDTCYGKLEDKFIIRVVKKNELSKLKNIKTDNEFFPVRRFISGQAQMDLPHRAEILGDPNTKAIMAKIEADKCVDLYDVVPNVINSTKVGGYPIYWDRKTKSKPGFNFAFQITSCPNLGFAIKDTDANLYFYYSKEEAKWTVALDSAI